MAPATIPTTEPTEAIAGLTWRWDRVVTDYTPAAGWALKYAFRGVSSLDLTGTADASNSGWELTASAATTGALLGGLYVWTAYVESGAEKYAVGHGTLTVLPNPLTANDGELQAFAERALKSIEATIEARVAADMSAYTFKERSVQREELEQLQAMRSRLLAEIEAQKSGGASMGRRVEWRPRAYR